MTDNENTLRIEINSQAMAWLFLVLGLAVMVVGAFVFTTDEPWYGALGITLAGLAFVAVTFSSS
jgi:hypothetical protein